MQTYNSIHANAAIKKQSARPDRIVLFISVHRLKSFTLQDLDGHQKVRMWLGGLP